MVNIHTEKMSNIIAIREIQIQSPVSQTIREFTVKFLFPSDVNSYTYKVSLT